MGMKNNFIESNSLIGIIDNFLQKQQYRSPKERGGHSVPPGPPPKPGDKWLKAPGSKEFKWHSKEEIQQFQPLNAKQSFVSADFKDQTGLENMQKYLENNWDKIERYDEKHEGERDVDYTAMAASIASISDIDKFTPEHRKFVQELLKQFPPKDSKKPSAKTPAKVAPIVQPPKATKQQNANYPLPSAMTDEYRKKIQSMKGTQEGALYVMQYLNHHDNWNTWEITDELSNTTIKNAKHDIALLSKKQDQLSDREQIRMQKLSRYFWGKLFGGKKTGRPGLWTERYKAVKEAKAKGEVPSGIRRIQRIIR